MKNDWFEIWFEDKTSMLDTMVGNMAADLEVGYDYFGNCIRRQQEEINEYKARFDEECEKLKDMDENKANRWCYIDLKKRGAIA